MGLYPGLGRSPGERLTPGFLHGKIPWTEGPGRLQFMGYQRIGHDLVTKQQQLLSIYDKLFFCLLKIIIYNNNWTVLYNNDMKVKVKLLSCVRLFATPWTVAHRAPLSIGFSRQEY